jgi:hypothetical protein
MVIGAVGVQRLPLIGILGAVALHCVGVRRVQARSKMRVSWARQMW